MNVNEKPSAKLSETPTPGIKQLRDAIPKHCFEASTSTSLAYVVQDVALSVGLAMLAYNINFIPDTATRWLLWSVYGAVQGMVFCGIWIIAHECGHQAFFNNRIVNDTFGFILHSMLLVPYFSWKYSHGLHHRYTNHMEKDTAFVPFRKAESKPWAALLETMHVAEDAPALNFFMLLAHQLFGFPTYLLFNISAGVKSTQRQDRQNNLRQSHFDPLGDIFTKQQHPYILLSDLGLVATLAGLYWLASKIGVSNVILLYGVPYLWVNNWIVAITYLHHTHPSSKHFEAETWNFRDGAVNTIDRDFGYLGKYVMHGIIEHHVVHHFFTHIPFYHAEEATEAIKGVLGDRYLCVKTPFWKDLWETFRSCRHVEASERAKGVLVWAQN